MSRIFFLFCQILVFCSSGLFAETHRYKFSKEPIDVIIPCTEKDLDTLELCIAGIRENCRQIRRIIVVSARPLTHQAEWVNEAIYPFTKEEIALHLLKGDAEAALEFLKPPSRVGWYYQQMLKYYAPFVIPEISSNVLIVDADTIFLRPVKFLDDRFAGLYNTGPDLYPPYFEHARRFIPGFRRVNKKQSGICHHMLFQTPVLRDLFSLVETHHKKPLWQAFCDCVSLEEVRGAGASEYEIYFNFALSRTDQVKIRPLKWKNVKEPPNLLALKSRKYAYVSWHSYSRQ